ncbi:MAG: hypothetical protein D6706_08720, partial [Chloroflexi bacterium]
VNCVVAFGSIFNHGISTVVVGEDVRIITRTTSQRIGAIITRDGVVTAASEDIFDCCNCIVTQAS